MDAQARLIAYSFSFAGDRTTALLGHRM